MRHFDLSSVTFVVALAVTCATISAQTGNNGPNIGDKKSGGSNDVKMDVLSPGNQEPMNAIARQQGNDVILEVNQGGTTTAKPVEIAHGKCPTPGVAQYKLPPYSGGQYTTTVKNAKLDALEDDNHAIAVYTSNGKKRSTYACGDLVKPNAFRH